jgi:hypothetical protein
MEKVMQNQIVNPQIHIGDEIVHSFWTELGVITRTGRVIELYESAGRPYCIYLDDMTQKPCGFYLDSECAITIL